MHENIFCLINCLLEMELEFYGPANTDNVMSNPLIKFPEPLRD